MWTSIGRQIKISLKEADDVEDAKIKKMVDEDMNVGKETVSNTKVF